MALLVAVIAHTFAKRILIEAKIYEEFTTLLKVRLAKLRMGNPLDSVTHHQCWPKLYCSQTHID